ncbi:MAG: hypothetical protein AAGI34_07170 [Pseudomonadota bacterium]
MSTPAVETVTAIQRPEPPLDLNEMETDVWIAVVNDAPANWWNAATLPMLAQYCRHVVGASRISILIDQAYAAEEIDLGLIKELTNLQSKHTASIKACLASMRLSQQSSYSARGAAGAKARHTTVERPWQS